MFYRVFLFSLEFFFGVKLWSASKYLPATVTFSTFRYRSKAILVSVWFDRTALGFSIAWESFCVINRINSPIICCKSKSSLYIDARDSSDYPFYNIVLLLRSTLIDVIRIIRCRLSRVRTYLLRKYALTHRVGKWPCSLRHLIIILQQSVLWRSLHFPSATSHRRR